MLGRAMVMVAVLAAPASADDRLLGADATVGVYDGVGAGIKIGDSHVGAHLIAAWEPLLMTGTGSGLWPGTITAIHSSLQANADLYVLFSAPTPRSLVGMTAGYKWSTLMGHGVGLGFYATIDAPKRVSYFLLVGIGWFPKGVDRLREKNDLPPGYEYAYPPPSMNFGANVGIMFSP